MNSSKIVILTSYSTQIGSGHYHRSRNIKKFLLQKLNITSDLVVKVTNPNEFNFSCGPNEFVIPNFEKDTLIPIVSLTNILITDLLTPDLIEIAYLKPSFVRLRIISILSFNENLKKPLFDIGLFGNLNEYSFDTKTRIISGQSALFLDLCFLEKKEEIRRNEKSSSVLLFFGGTDPFNISQVVYDIINNESEKFSYFNFKLFSSNTKLKSKSNIEIFDISNKYFEELSNSDLAIINGGISRYETVISGIPTIAISIHEEQFNITKKVSDKTGMINMGLYNEITPEALYTAIRTLLFDQNVRNKYIENCSKIKYHEENGYNTLKNLILNEKAH